MTAAVRRRLGDPLVRTVSGCVIGGTATTPSAHLRQLGRRAYSLARCADKKSPCARNFAYQWDMVPKEDKRVSRQTPADPVILGSPTWARTRDLRINS